MRSIGDDFINGSDAELFCASPPSLPRQQILFSRSATGVDGLQKATTRIGPMRAF